MVVVVVVVVPASLDFDAEEEAFVAGVSLAVEEAAAAGAAAPALDPSAFGPSTLAPPSSVMSCLSTSRRLFMSIGLPCGGGDGSSRALAGAGARRIVPGRLLSGLLLLLGLRRLG